MSGDGPDGWPDDHLEPGHDDQSGSTEPGTPDDEHSSEFEAAPTGEPGNLEGHLDGEAVEPDLGTPDDPDPDAVAFEPADEAEPVGPDPDVPVVDDTHAGVTPSPVSPNRWTEAIGYGATDPAGTQAGFFDQVDLSDADPMDTGDPDWLTDELASARSTWVDPDLLDRSGPRESARLDRASGDEAVAGLWGRLSPDTPIPTGPSGDPDLAGALDALAARAGPTPLLQVIDAARRLLDE